jgi:hypothetical protein
VHIYCLHPAYLLHLHAHLSPRVPYLDLPQRLQTSCRSMQSSPSCRRRWHCHARLRSTTWTWPAMRLTPLLSSFRPFLLGSRLAMLVSPGGLHLPKGGLTLLLDGVSEELKNVEKPWPRDENSPTHTINYCYLVKWTRQSVSEYVEPAVKMWMGKLGEPGPDNKHPITFKEARDSDENPVTALKGNCGTRKLLMTPWSSPWQ